jgi:hypothetical protein
MRTLAFLCAMVGCFAALPAGQVQAAPPWVERPLTLPTGEWALDLGVGAGTNGAETTVTASDGVGLSAEAGFGLTERLELGLRLGFSSLAESTSTFPGVPAPRGNYDDYARLFDRMTFDQGSDHVANPEVRIRGAILRDAVGEIALEGRLVAPLGSHSGVGLSFGVPFALHFGARLRIDAGAYEVVVLSHSAGAVTGGQPANDLTAVSLQAPMAIWIQLLPSLWFGPIGSLGRDLSGASPQQPWSGSVGFGFGYQIGDSLDAKAILLFPALGSDQDAVGAGLGVQWRIN